MFWKKKPATGEPKAKEPSPKEIIINQIERLGLGQTVSYRLPETFGGELAVIELNQQYLYQKKARKYILSMEKVVGGKAAGKKSLLFASNNPMHIASWILDRNGLFIGAE